MAAKKKEASVEQIFDEIEQILVKMEEPDTGLEDSFKLYKEGITKLQKCNEVIEQVEKNLIEI